MPAWGDLFPEGGVAQQFLLWGVAYNLAQTLLGPALQGVTNELWQAAAENVGGFAHVPLTPADLADAVIRNFATRDGAAREASQSGMSGEDFALMVDLAGDAIAPGEAAVALRRKLIAEDGVGPDSTSFTQAIAEGRLKDKWAPIVKALATEWPTPTDALQAFLEGQVDEATARDLYERFGGDLDYFQMLYDTRGSAPTPVEAGRMANRGIIGWTGTGPAATSFEQAFLEGPWRNKWEPAMARLAEYVPPPRTITTLMSHGVLSQAEADQYFRDNGMSAKLAQEYTDSATAERTVKQRELTEATVVNLYEDRYAPRAQAQAMLGALGYSADDANYLLELADFRQAFKVVNSAVTRIGTLFVAGKLTADEATEALGRLAIPSDQVGHLLSTWQTEHAANVRILTPGEITSAVFYGVKSEGWGIAQLQQLGYTAHDAWVLLSIRAKGPLPDEPADLPRGPLP